MSNRAEALLGHVLGSASLSTTASWRAKTDGPWHLYDAAIYPDHIGKIRQFKVHVYGHPVATTQTLADAKALVGAPHTEELKWRTIRPEDADKERWDPVWGFTTEFNHPKLLHVVDRLPRLGDHTK